MKEIDSKEFFPLKGYEGLYEINTKGDIRSIDRMGTTKGYNGTSSYDSYRKGVLKKSSQNGSGYLQMHLSVNGKEYREYVHRLVYDTFIGIKDKKNDIDHLDHNKLNCSLENLEEVTHEENMRRMRKFYGIEAKPKHELKEKKSRRTYTYDEMEKVLERLRTEPMSKVCKDYGISDKGLSKRLKSVGLPYQMKEINKYFNNN